MRPSYTSPAALGNPRVLSPHRLLGAAMFLPRPRGRSGASGSSLPADGTRKGRTVRGSWHRTGAWECRAEGHRALWSFRETCGYVFQKQTLRADCEAQPLGRFLVGSEGPLPMRSAWARTAHGQFKVTFGILLGARISKRKCFSERMPPLSSLIPYNYSFAYIRSQTGGPVNSRLRVPYPHQEREASEYLKMKKVCIC